MKRGDEDDIDPETPLATRNKLLVSKILEIHDQVLGAGETSLLVSA